MRSAALLLWVLLLPLPLLAEDILAGSPESRALESAKVDELGFERIEDERSMMRLVKESLLVPVPNDDYVRWHRKSPRQYAFSLPHTHDFLVKLGKDFRKVFNKPIIVTSAIRPKSYQKKLALRNRNAAPVDGPLASTHPTGATIDIGYKKLRRQERLWLEAYLAKKEAEGFVQATKERHQACFHVMVYASGRRLATLRKNSPR